MVFIFIIFVIVAMSTFSAKADFPIGSTQMMSQRLTDKLKSPEYNRLIRPHADTGPVDVFINYEVADISEISEVNMEYSVSIFLREIWWDDRLAFPESNRSFTLHSSLYDQLWYPDLFVRNVKAGILHSITVTNRLLRLFPDGKILHSQRLTLTLFCIMQLERYPMDNQTCKIEFGTYAFTVEDLKFNWRTDAPQIEFTNELYLPEYVITNVSTIVCTYAGIGTKPCLRGYFHLSRRLKSYILGVYLPQFLVVLLSWLSFWIDPQSVPARTSLSLLTILTITTQSSTTMRGMPSGSITKAIDVWMSTCLVFVFGAFIEYSIINTLSRKNVPRRKPFDVEKGSVDSASVTGFNNDVTTLNVSEKSMTSVRRRLQPIINWRQNPVLAVELASRIVFPFVFFVFNLIYWPYYLFIKNDLSINMRIN